VAMTLQLAANHAQRQMRHSSTQTIHDAMPGTGKPLIPIEMELLSCFDAYDENADSG
jgi:hypothetical protein